MRCGPWSWGHAPSCWFPLSKPWYSIYCNYSGENFSGIINSRVFLWKPQNRLSKRLCVTLYIRSVFLHEQLGGEKTAEKWLLGVRPEVSGAPRLVGWQISCHFPPYIFLSLLGSFHAHHCFRQQGKFLLWKSTAPNPAAVKGKPRLLSDLGTGHGELSRRVTAPSGATRGLSRPSRPSEKNKGPVLAGGPGPPPRCDRAQVPGLDGSIALSSPLAEDTIKLFISICCPNCSVWWQWSGKRGRYR